MTWMQNFILTGQKKKKFQNPKGSKSFGETKPSGLAFFESAKAKLRRSIVIKCGRRPIVVELFCNFQTRGKRIFV